MKKIILVLFLSVPGSILFAQTAISLRAAPSITLTSLKKENNHYSNDFRNENPGASLSVGITGGLNADFPIIKERLMFSTGVWYAIKNFTLDIKTPIRPMIYNPDTQEVTYMLVEKDPRYLLHYVQTPITFKVFTDKYENGSRFYFQAGAILNFKIAEQAIDKEHNYLYQLSQRVNGGSSVLRSFDFSLYGAVGYEWKLKSGKYFSIAFSMDKGMLKQLKAVKWNSELAPLDYYFNTKLTQMAVACHYTLIAK